MPLEPVFKARLKPGTDPNDEVHYRRAIKAFFRSFVTPDMINRMRRGIEARKKPTEIAKMWPWFDKRDPGADPKWAKLLRDIGGAHSHSLQQAGQKAADNLPRGRFRFRVEKAAKKPTLDVPPNPYSLKWLRERGGELIVQISDGQRDSIVKRIARGYVQGERPQDMIDSIKRNVGLTARMSDAVDNRRALVFSRTQNEDAAERAAKDYHAQLLDQRAETIARTESKAAQSQGQQDAWMVAKDQGLLPKTTRKRWVSMPESPRLSDICRELDGQVVDLDEPFHSDELGEDIDAPPAHPNCRSTIVLEFGESDAAE